MPSFLTAEEQTSLAQRVRDGDPAAEELFARLFGERIRVMMVARIGDGEAARDLTQEVMMASWCAIRREQLRNPERLAAFVHGVARNVVKNYFRTQAGKPAVQPLEGEAERVAAPRADPDPERRAVVSAALARLSPDDRQVLILTLVEGLPPRDIAARLGLSAEVVRARKTRATRRIIDAVAEVSLNRSPDHEDRG